MKITVPFILAAIVLINIIPAGLAYETLTDVQPGFPVSTGGKSIGNILFANVTGDSDLEVIVSSSGGMLRTFDSSGGLIFSKGNGLGGTTSAPAVGDVDGDSELEIVYVTSKAVSSYRGSSEINVEIYSGTGTLERSWSISQQVSDLSLADLSGDNRDEIIFGTHDGGLYVYSNTGLLWSKFSVGIVSSKPAIGDITVDGLLDIIVTSKDGNVYAFQGDGTPLWSNSVNITSSSPGLGGNGFDVAVATNDGKLFVWNGTGSLVSGWPVDIGKVLYSSPVVGDIDYDGTREVIVGSDDGYVYAFHHDGSPVPGWPVSTGKGIMSRPALFDIDGDSNLEIISGSKDGKLYAWNADGTHVHQFPIVLSTVWWVASFPAVGDIDHDGDIEIGIGSDDTMLHVYKIHTLIPPQAVISSPLDNLVYNPGDFINFISGSSDNGIITSHTWTSNLSGQLSKDADFTSNTLEIGSHTITLEVVDDDLLTDSASIMIRINAPPIINELSPSGGSVFTLGSLIQFTANLIDPDGTIASTSWSSDLSGHLSTTATFSTSELSAGLHTISFEAKDNDGGSTSVSFLLEINTPPHVEIISPADTSTFRKGENILFKGNASDADGIISGYSWVDDVDHQLGNIPEFSLSNLSAGLHIVTFTATDNEGAFSSGQVKFEIRGKDGGSKKQPKKGSVGDPLGNIFSKYIDPTSSDTPSTDTPSSDTSRSSDSTIQSVSLDSLASDQTPIIVEELIHTSVHVDSFPLGIIYRNINIYPETSNETGPFNATIEFRVNKDWPLEFGIDLGSITLYYFSNDIWEPLSSTLIRDDPDYLYYQAVSPGLSYFSIPGEKKAEETIPEAAKSLGGFELLLGLVFFMVLFMIS
ncbi:MAG: PGF-pre-PGF domain-containing protein, partial [ANME-2 cluster archaeon]